MAGSLGALSLLTRLRGETRNSPGTRSGVRRRAMAPRRVVMVAMPCREVVEVGGALDIFYAANVRLPADRGYAVEVVSPVTTVCGWTGLRLAADRSYRAVRGDIDTLIVTGIDEPDDAQRDPDLIRWLARTGPRARRVVGLCTGTFVLAEAGLLDGRSATTHWMDCDDARPALPRRARPARPHLRSRRRRLHLGRQHGRTRSRAGPGGGRRRSAGGAAGGAADGLLPQATGRPGAVQRPALHAAGRARAPARVCRRGSSSTRGRICRSTRSPAASR